LGNHWPIFLYIFSIDKTNLTTYSTSRIGYTLFNGCGGYFPNILDFLLCVILLSKPNFRFEILWVLLP